MQSVHNNNVLVKWCKENGLMLQRKGGPTSQAGPQETHLFLSGGRACVPDELHGEFLKKMAEAVWLEQAWVYVVEKKTNPGRMFVELDLLLWDRRLSTEDILRCVIPPFSKVMQMAFPGQNLMAVVCTAAPTVMAVDEFTAPALDGATAPIHRRREQIKNGIHVIWPHIVVTPERMWMLRAWFMYELSVVGMPGIAPESLCERWDKILDPCVFISNGMRLIWNRKASICKVCNGVPFQSWMSKKCKSPKGAPINRPDFEPCKACNTFDNRVDEGRPYDIAAIINTEDAVAQSELLKDPVVALEMTTIRIIGKSTVTPIIMPENIRMMIEPWMSKKSVTSSAPKAQGKGLKRPESDDSKAHSLISIVSTDMEYGVIAKYVTTRLECGVVAIKSDPDKHIFIVNTTLRKCLNKGGEHKRSTVYFLFYPDGYCQKCWCKTGDIYRTGGVPCLGWKSQLIPYHSDDISELRTIFTKHYANKFPVGDSADRGKVKRPAVPQFYKAIVPGRAFVDIKKDIEERAKDCLTTQIKD
jgi:hypothetical protein